MWSQRIKEDRSSDTLSEGWEEVCTPLWSERDMHLSVGINTPNPKTRRVLKCFDWYNLVSTQLNGTVFYLSSKVFHKMYWFDVFKKRFLKMPYLQICVFSHDTLFFPLLSLSLSLIQTASIFFNCHVFSSFFKHLLQPHPPPPPSLQ